MKTSRGGFVAALGLAAALILSGCSIAPSGTATGGGTSGGGQSGQTGGGEASTAPEPDEPVSPDDPANPGDNPFGGLPSSFPSDEVPVIDNPVEMGVDLGTGWSLLMKVDDYRASFSEASALLTAAGFETVAEQLGDTGGVGVFQDEKYQIQLAASESPDNGPQLTYVVILRG